MILITHVRIKIEQRLVKITKPRKSFRLQQFSFIYKNEVKSRRFCLSRYRAVVVVYPDRPEQAPQYFWFNSLPPPWHVVFLIDIQDVMAQAAECLCEGRAWSPTTWQIQERELCKGLNPSPRFVLERNHSWISSPRASDRADLISATMRFPTTCHVKSLVALVRTARRIERYLALSGKASTFAGQTPRQ